MVQCKLHRRHKGNNAQKTITTLRKQLSELQEDIKLGGEREVILANMEHKERLAKEALQSKHDKTEGLLDRVGCFLMWINMAENLTMKKSVSWIEELYLEIDELLKG